MIPLKGALLCVAVVWLFFKVIKTELIMLKHVPYTVPPTVFFYFASLE